jgi:hypothetical protein
MTEAQIALARRLMANGVTRKVIAQHTQGFALDPLSRPQTLCCGSAARKARLSLGRRERLTEAQIAHARRLLANGVPRKIIASTLKVSRTTLSIALKPYGMGPHSQMVRRNKRLLRRRFRPAARTGPRRDTKKRRETR